ncbi:hypothetical protein [Nakamurella multipartita]|uniref:Integral membrane protein n=1 Tax=Nakamurella multipartita (strain ATCC 700099 / DSM 44233 / CIP 104796 / JCM 9543 / NBRC 105858 / Y-104) TaxID=479431 RepID=C8XHL4_NAKMY|nr:hypothetical protein [Nakamurella multipartita]ACV80317.1 hypothetical protein Namu_4025 [Nakamurella multipartita DSM 44233]
MSGVNTPGRARIAARTLRTDHWRRAPLVTFLGLSLFVVYGTVRAFWAVNYYAAPYLSPFYSPCITTACVPEASDFGQPIAWWPLSPALLILIFPLGFRLTCYYYRKAYYRSFWQSPTACAVAEPHKRYTGETQFPLIMQNVHRYFWYVAMIFGVILTYDAILSFRNPAGDWGHMGLGTVILLINAGLIWLYTLSCHSCRHIMGGKLKHFSRHPIRYKAWQQISKLNAKHMQLAWVSLIWLAVTDFYIVLLASGTIHDLRFF